MSEERFLIKIVDMYYKDGLSQAEIGKKLSVARSTVSRMLIKARNEGYIQININYPKDTAVDLEKLLENQFDLDEVIIAFPKDGGSAEGEVAYLASDYMIRVLKDGLIIGMTRGKAMRDMIKCFEKDMRLKFLSLKNTVVVPLMGAADLSANSEREYRLIYSNYLLEEVANIMNGISYDLAALQVVSSPEIKRVFESEEPVKRVLKMAENADIAMLGIGNISSESSIIKANIVPQEEYERLKEKGAVGEIAGRIYDINGNTIKDEFDDRTIGVSLENLKKIPIRVGVAFGDTKLEAILGALRGEIINVLITDKSTAEALLDARKV